MKLLFEPFRKYAVFAGRSTRTEFWVFAFLYLGLTMAANYIDALDGIRRPVAGRFGMAELVVSLVLLMPLLSVGARRLHDSGRSGWWMMMLYIPYLGWTLARNSSSAELMSLGGVAVGFIALMVFFLLPGDGAHNEYGASPRAASPIAG
jgi:uncharacterized membrane protein YhaH (DUF805 family)